MISSPRIFLSIIIPCPIIFCHKRTPCPIIFTQKDTLLSGTSGQVKYGSTPSDQTESCFKNGICSLNVNSFQYEICQQLKRTYPDICKLLFSNFKEALKQERNFLPIKHIFHQNLRFLANSRKARKDFEVCHWSSRALGFQKRYVKLWEIW